WASPPGCSSTRRSRSSRTRRRPAKSHPARPLSCHGGGHAVRIAFVTAGAGGMYCGSCLRDNTLVTALRARGHDALLVPTYTPLRTDEPDVSQRRIFFGGINVYLEQKFWLFRHTPRWLDRLLGFRWLLRWVSRFARR